MRFCSQPSALRRYLADSSYWLYLGHLPIVFGLQAALMKVPLHWAIKFPLIVAITLAVLLASYHYLVRPTFIGALLNGRKYPRGSATTARAALRRRGERRSRRLRSPMLPHGGAERAPVAQLTNVMKRYGKTVALDGVSLDGPARRAAGGARSERRRQVDGHRSLARHCSSPTPATSRSWAARRSTCRAGSASA